MVIIVPRLLTVTLSVEYYRPDFPSILQAFVWQLDDRTPDFPRVHRFLDHWRREITAPIATIRLVARDGVGWRALEEEWRV